VAGYITPHAVLTGDGGGDLDGLRLARSQAARSLPVNDQVVNQVGIDVCDVQLNVSGGRLQGRRLDDKPPEVNLEDGGVGS
jgi:hypothetical protein